MNHGTITSTLSLFKIWPLNGFNPIRAKQRVLRRRKRVYQSFSSRRKSPESFTLTILWNLANLVKTYDDNIVHQHTIDPRQNDIAERAVRRVKEGTSAVLLQSGFDERCWADSMECHCYLRNVQDLRQMGKRFSKDDFENHSKSQ